MFRWLLHDWNQRRHENIYYMRAYTRPAFHAYLFYSKIAPIKARLYEPRRGGYCLFGDYWWPMPLSSWQQLEPGDTLQHSWITPPLDPGETYYLMVFCSPDPTFLGSTSPIWAIRIPKPPYYKLITLEDWNTGEQPWRPKPTFTIQVTYEPWNE